MSSKEHNKKKKFYIWLFITVLLLTVICVLIFFALDKKLTLTEYTFSSERVPESFNGYKILAICDLHSQYFGEGQSELIDCIRSANPDLIVLLGDIIDANDTLFTPLEELLSDIYSDYTIYAISGNHEKALSYSDMQKLRELYSNYGVKLLENEGVALSVDNTSVLYSKIARAYGKTIVSKEEITAYAGNSDDRIMLWGGDDPPVWNDSALEYIAENGLNVSAVPYMFNLLLYHRANLFPEVSKYGFDLTLSGHLHGGQVRLPFIGGLISPTRKWFPKYTAGIYKIENENKYEGMPKVSSMIVGRGLGNTASIPRIFNPPEVFAVILTTEK